MTRRSGLFIVILGGAVAGCSGTISAPKTTPVKGSVLYRGKPAAGVRVTFHPQFRSGAVQFTPSGLTDKDGVFTLSTAAAGDGAPVGEYVVTFDLPQVESDRANSGIEVEVDAWKGKYSDPAASTWKVRVEKGDNELAPFRLD